MHLADRDRAVVGAVARFGQMSSGQVREVLFDDVTATPCHRALQRLVKQHYLARIEKRLVGGRLGGSGQYAYQLGRRGYYLHFEGKYSPFRSVSYHSLAICDTYIRMLRLERAGLLEIKGYTTEPDTHVQVGSHYLKPDLYAHLSSHLGQRHIWFEIDMASQGQRQITDKLERYWQAYQETNWPVWPAVWFVAVDEERRKELAWLVSRLKDDAKSLFTITTLDDLAPLLVSA